MEVNSEATRQTDYDRSEDDRRDAQKDKYMTFRLGNEYYGLKIQYVNEIIPYQTITAIPETAEYIKGLVNLQGGEHPAAAQHWPVG